MNNKLKIPKPLHELFGEEQLRSELFIIVIFSVISFTALITGTFNEWRGLPWYKVVLLFIFAFDILGGVAANLSTGTNWYYQSNPSKRWIFIAIHIQPFIFAWLFQVDFMAAFSVWAYTLCSSAVINLLLSKEYQRILAGALLGFGVLGFLLMDFKLPIFIDIIYILYMFKLIFGFSVNHHKQP
jgi:hypothetical protein